jgi:type IV pilus assembly protein PilO
MATKPQVAPAAGSSLDRLSPAAKVGVGLLFVALVGVLYFVFVFSDDDTAITSAHQREQSLTAELARATASKEDYQKDLDEKTRREQLAREQKKILPDDPEMPAFLSALQGVATISGVNLTSWSPTEEETQEFFAKVPMKLTLTGRYHQLAKFFQAVGQLDRIINIENIQFKNPKLVADEMEVEVECLATAFRAIKAGEVAGTTKRRGAQH